MNRSLVYRALGLAGGLFIAGCAQDSTGVHGTRAGRLAIAPVFDARALRLVDFDRVRILLVRPGTSEVVLDTVVLFPAGADSVALSVSVPVQGSGEHFSLALAMVNTAGDTVFRGGPADIAVQPGILNAAPAQTPIRYTGVGSNAATVRFVAPPGSAFFGDTALFAAEALDSAGHVIPNTPIVFSVSDSTRARVPDPAVGRVVAQAVRGNVDVLASLLTPPLARTTLTVQPRPTTLAIQSGNNQTGTVGGALAQQLSALVGAADGLGVRGITVNFAVATGGGTLSAGTAVTDSAGRASVTWTLGTATGAQTVTAAAAGLTPASVTFAATAAAGAARSLVYTVAPPTSVAATSTFNVTVAARDTFGNVAAGFTGPVALAFGANPGSATLLGTTTLNAVAGVAAFTVRVAVAATGYTLVASSAGLPSVTSTAISVTAGAPAHLVFATPPSNVVAGAAIAPAVVVSVLDAAGNLVGTATDSVNVSLRGGTGATLGGTRTVNAVAGRATFSDLTVDRAGTGYQLVPASGAMARDTSVLFAVTPGAAARLAFAVQPSAVAAGSAIAPAVVVRAEDAFGNPVATYAGTVAIGIGTNPAGGTLSGTATVTAVAGVATFAGLSIDNIGTGYTLTASASGMAAGISSAFDVTASATVNAWVNVSGGNWSTASNWSKGTVPTATDTVYIKQSGTYTVVMDQNVSVTRLEVGGSSGTQTLQVGANTLTLNGTNVMNTRGQLALSGGTIAGAGSLDVGGAFNWSSGNLSGSGGTARVLSGGTLAISGTAGRTFTNAVLELAGTGTWTGTHAINSGLGAVLRVLSGGTLDVQGDPTFSNNQGGTAARLQVLGTLLRTTSSGAAVMAVEYDNDAQTTVTSGTLRLAGGSGAGTADGTYTANAGGTLEFAGGAHALGALGAMGGTGTVLVSGGTVNDAGALAVTGGMSVAGGTFNYNNVGGGTTGTLVVSGGTLGGSGLLQVSGSMTWSGGDLVGSGGTARVLSGGTLAISGTAGRTFTNAVLELAGTGTWTGTHAINSGLGAVLRVLSGGTLDVQGDPTFSNNQGGTAARLQVLGTLLRTTSSGAAVMAVEYDNDAQTTVTSGTLRLAGGSGAGTADGTYAANAGGTLEFAGGAHALGALGAMGGTGTVLVSGGTVNDAGALAVTGTVSVPGGTFNYDRVGGGQTAGLVVSGGTLGGAGLLQVTGSMTWSGGDLVGSGGTARVLSGGTLAISGTAGRTFTNAVLELAGTGTWTGTHAINSGLGAVLRVLSGGTLDVQGDPTFSNNQGGTAARLQVLGTLLRTTSSGAAVMAVEYDNDAQTTVTSGTLRLAGGSGAGTADGTYTANAGGTLEFAGGAHALGALGAMGGTGTVLVSGGTVNDAGALAVTGTVSVPGGTFNYDRVGGGQTAGLVVSGGTLGGAGLLQVTGSMTWSGGNVQGSGGTARVLSGGTLAISGTAGRTFTNAVLELAGTGTWTGTHAINSGLGAVLRVLSGGTLDVQGDPTFSNNQGGTATLLDVQASGTLARTTSANAAVMGVAVNKAGTLNVQSGTLRFTNGGAATFGGAVTGSGLLDLAGGTFTLSANLAVAGPLQVGGGSLVFSATNRTVTVGSDFATAGGGTISMSNAADSLLVTGNATFGGGTSALSNGVIRVAGNFTETGAGSQFAPGPNTSAQRVVLTGTAAQTVTFANTSSSFFRRLEVNKSAGGVVLASNVKASWIRWVSGATLSGAFRLLTDTIYSPQIGGHTFTPLAIEVAGVYGDSGAAGWQADTTVFTGTNQTVALNNTTFLNYAYKSIRVAQSSGTATINGAITLPNDLVVSSGTLSLGGFHVGVAGNFRTESTGVLRMVSLTDSLGVGGSVTFGGGSTTGTLTKGVLDVKGNFVQTGTSGSQFAASGTHRVRVLRSSGVQTIQFQDTVGSYFNDLMLNRPTVDTVRLVSSVLVNDSAILSGSSWLASTAYQALRTATAGVLRVHSGAMLRPSQAAFGVLFVDSANTGSARILPDTAVFLNGGSTYDPTGTAAYQWKSVRVAGGSVSSGAPGVVYRGNLIVSGGTYNFPAYTSDSVAGFFRTEGTGTLTMSNGPIGQMLIVRDSAVFAGGTSALAGGAMRVWGNFVQRGSATSFQASGTHITGFPGTAAQTISFASPSATASGSQFNTLTIANSSASGVTLLSNVFANGQLQDPGTTAVEQLYGNGNTLTVGGVNIWHFQFNNAPLVIDTLSGPQTQRMDTVTFAGSYASSATILQVRGNATRATLTFWGLTFPGTPPNPGYYLDARKMTIGAAFTVNLYGTSPSLASNGGRTVTNLGPGGTATLTWSP